MKRLTFLSVLLLSFSMSIHAYPVGLYFVIGNLYYKVTSSTTVSCVSPYSGAPTTVVVPKTVKGHILDWDTNQYTGEEVGPYTVTGLGDGNSHDWGSVKSLTLPNTITTFYDNLEFENLESVRMPKKLKQLGSTFAFLKKLKSVTFPSNAELEEIGMSAFLDCTALKEFHVPASVTTIGTQAFSGCTNLELVTMPANSKLTTIEGRAFKDCTSLSQINVNAAAAIRKSILPKGVTEISFLAFKGCAFSVMELPENLTSIGSSAFSSCNNLKEIYLPASLLEIGSSAFAGCPKLERVYSSRIEPNAIGYTTFDNSVYENAELLVHEKSKYKDVYAWSEFKHIVDMDGEYTFLSRTYDITATGNGEVRIPKDEEFDLGAGAKLLSLFDGATIRNEHKSVVTSHWAAQSGFTLQFLPDGGHRIKQVLMKLKSDEELRDVTSNLEYQGGRVYTYYINDMSLSISPQIVATFESVNNLDVKGDLNGDSEVNKDDIVDVVVDVMDPMSGYDEDKDINNDEVVNVVDIVELNNIIKNK